MAQRQAALEIPLGDWLQAEVSNPSVGLALSNMVKSMYSEFPERASLGRLMDMLAGFARRRSDDSGSGFVDDPEVGGRGPHHRAPIAKRWSLPRR